MRSAQAARTHEAIARLKLAIGATADWRHPLGVPRLASCECYEGCSPGVGLGNCWLPTIGNPGRSPE